MAILRDRPSNFKVLSGDDAFSLPLVTMGGKGVISVLAQGLPKEFSTMVSYVLDDNNLDQARDIHYKILDFVDPLFSEGNPAGIKKMLKLLKICDDNVRLPLVKASDSIENTIKDIPIDKALNMIAMKVLSGIGGSSGALFGTFFMSMAKTTDLDKNINFNKACEMIINGIQAMKEKL